MAETLASFPKNFQSVALMCFFCSVLAAFVTHADFPVFLSTDLKLCGVDGTKGKEHIRSFWA